MGLEAFNDLYVFFLSFLAVLLQESTLSELLEKQCPQSPTTKTLSLCGTKTENSVVEPCCPLAESQHLPFRKDSVLLDTKANQSLDELQGSEHLCSPQDLLSICGSEDPLMVNHNHMEGNEYHLHLSSCHECLELENSTILSVQYASSENISELADENLDKGVSGVDTVSKVAQNAGGSCILNSSFKCNHKPPNVLVYTSGCQERYAVVSKLLSECIGMENNIIYPLLPQQALSDPWLDNTRLLVLAEEEPLTSLLQTLFLRYLSLGGRILGLASTFCPPGICLNIKERQQGQVSRMSFTRENSTELELDLLASGNVYTRDTQEGPEVEFWGELKLHIPNQKDIVIVKVAEKGNVGEAVLCQVKKFTSLKL